MIRTRLKKEKRFLSTYSQGPYRTSEYSKTLRMESFARDEPGKCRLETSQGHKN